MKTFKNANGWSRSGGTVIIKDSKPDRNNEVKCRKLDLGFGSHDDVYLFTEGKHLIVMSEQPRLGYVGVSVFTKKGDPVWDCFWQNEQDLPAGIFDLVPINRAKYFFNWNDLF